MIDEACMDFMLSHTEKGPNYVVAVDAESEDSEQWTSKTCAGPDDWEMV